MSLQRIPIKAIISPLLLKEIKVIDSKNKNLIGLEGTVVYETKNTIKIKTLKKTIKTLIKNQCMFRIKINEKNYYIEGEYFVGKFSERLKKWSRKV